MGSPALRWLATCKVIRNSGAVKPSAPHSSTLIIFYHIKYKGHYFCSQNILFFSYFKHIIGLHFPPPLTFGMACFALTNELRGEVMCHFRAEALRASAQFIMYVFPSPTAIVKAQIQRKPPAALGTQ